MSAHELKIQEKKAVQSDGETTKNDTYFAPHVDIFETEQEVVVLADVPGVAPDGIDLALEDNILTIQAHRASSKYLGRLILEEYETGHYLRRFTVAETIDQDRIEASMVNGVLKVRLPKTGPAQPKKIEVKIG
ncbi:MAG: Hsp20/alpha crystallin family protein [Desulfobulbus sp.]|nr:Hsp20/alpha crystallin family protein [Desulfobulbus sp.]